MNRNSMKYKIILNDQVPEQLEFLKEKGQKKYFLKNSSWKISKFDENCEHTYQRSLTKPKHKIYIKKTPPWHIEANCLKPTIRRKC